MHSAQGAFSRVKGNVALNKSGLEAMFFELLAAPGAGKETSFVAHWLDVNLKYSNYFSRVKLHIDKFIPGAEREYKRSLTPFGARLFAPFTPEKPKAPGEVRFHERERLGFRKPGDHPQARRKQHVRVPLEAPQSSTNSQLVAGSSDSGLSTTDQLHQAMPPKFSQGRPFVAGNRAGFRIPCARGDSSSNPDGR